MTPRGSRLLTRCDPAKLPPLPVEVFGTAALFGPPNANYASPEQNIGNRPAT